MKHRLRIGIAIGLVLITLFAFIYYIEHHKYLITKLVHTPILTIIWLALLYTAWFGALCLIVWATLKICQKTLAIKEGFLLNAYSTLVNFFVPGQGGIAVRGAYLKKVKKLAVRNYIFVTLIYYAFYAVISAALLLFLSRPWWQTFGAVILIAAFSLGVIYLYASRVKISTDKLSVTKANVLYLFLATLLQAIIQTAIFGIELHSVNRNIAIRQMITYTGAANFSLFVALTPGAIGIREAFLLFTRHLNHISSSNIVAANVIDRAIFIVLLAVLFVVTIGFHARFRALSPRKENTETDPNVTANNQK